MIESTEQAIAAIKNTRLSEREREQGIHYVRDEPSTEGIEALVVALRDDDHGIRFAAANALAYLGAASMPALLQALAQPDTDVLLRKGATIVIGENTNPKVREQCQKLLVTLKGPQAGIATMEEAVRLMPSFR
jgi:HEAT repeat protein